MDTAAVEEIKRSPALLTGWLRAHELKPLLEVLLEPRITRRWRLMIIRKLPEFGDARVVPAVVQALADDDPGIRGHAAIALSDCLRYGMPVEGANEALLHCAEDRDDYPRMQALCTLSVLGEQRAVPILVEIAERSPVKNYRRAAVAALGRLGAPEAKTFFIRYLDDPDERGDAPWAASWLAEIGTEASIDPLRGAAKRLFRRNRRDYIEALEAIQQRSTHAAT